MNPRFLLQLTLLPIICCYQGCAVGGSEDDEAEVESVSETTTPAFNPSDFTGELYSTQCGIVLSGVLTDPIYASQGVRVQVTDVLDANLVMVQRPEGPQLVQLHGVGPATRTKAAAVAFLRDLAQEGAFLYATGSNCGVTTAGGGQGILGQLITESGRSYAEELLQAGFADQVGSSGQCREDLISSCYESIRVEPAILSAGEILDFLWKPSSDGGYNPGKLSILVDACNVTVLANGESIPDFGSGNGRCTTARSQRTGCSYGQNVRVEVIDNSSGLPYYHNGEPFVIVPNGCSRFEFRQ